MKHLVLLLTLLNVTQVQTRLVAKFTPPDARLVSCQIAIGTYVIAEDIVPYVCPGDPANDCVTVPLTLGPGWYPFQLVCAPGTIVRSNIVRTQVPR